MLQGSFAFRPNGPNVGHVAEKSAKIIPADSYKTLQINALQRIPFGREVAVHRDSTRIEKVRVGCRKFPVSGFQFPAAYIFGSRNRKLETGEWKLRAPERA